jgi:hypothetical protein
MAAAVAGWCQRARLNRARGLRRLEFRATHDRQCQRTKARGQTALSEVCLSPSALCVHLVPDRATTLLTRPPILAI